MYIFTDKDEQTEKIPLGQDLLCAFRVHPVHSQLVATGGDERELCVWDLSKDHKDFKPVWSSKNVKII